MTKTIRRLVYYIYRPLQVTFGQFNKFIDLSLQVAIVGYEVKATSKCSHISSQVPIASAKFTDLSLQIYLYKQFGKTIPWKDVNADCVGDESKYAKNGHGYPLHPVAAGVNLGLISSTFYEKLLRAQIPKAQKDTDHLTEFLLFWDLCA